MMHYWHKVKASQFILAAFLAAGLLVSAGIISPLAATEKKETAKAESKAEAESKEKAKQKPSLKEVTQTIPAKNLFGFVLEGAPMKARAIGYYTRGCLAGGKALDVNGPSWQAMRLSRNRNWGHPKLISFIEQLAKEVREKDGWPGLLVGDLSQPRGGPMLSGHRSHQMGLDADVWLNPMPNRRLTYKEREETSAISMLDSSGMKVNPNVWTENHVKVIKRAAGFPEVQRVLVHPAIKKALCQAAGNDRGWLSKVRPWYGHHYHMHIRLKCTEKSCKPQGGVPGGDGCGKELDYWFDLLRRPPKPGCIAGNVVKKGKGWVCTCPKNLKLVSLGKGGHAKCVLEDGTIPRAKKAWRNLDWMPKGCSKVLSAGDTPIFKSLTMPEDIELPQRKAAALQKAKLNKEKEESKPGGEIEKTKEPPTAQ